MDETGINWTDSTWNPWIGCTRVSPACKNCYMYRDSARYGRNPAAVTRTASGTWRRPLQKVRGGGYRWPDGSLVFTCSWSDWFHEAADAWRPDAWEVIRQRPGLTFQILTKRPERIADHLPPDWGDGWPNVWLGVTTEDQDHLDRRLGHLLRIPAAVRFVSAEPILGPVQLSAAQADGVGWVIIGGESGPAARHSDPAWFRTLARSCTGHGVPCFVKQLGEPWVRDLRRAFKTAGEQPPALTRTGHQVDELPADLRLRQMPAGHTAPMKTDCTEPGASRSRSD